MKNKLYVHVVLDNSGSMLPNKSATLRALNGYFDGLQEDAICSVNLFGTESKRHRTQVDREAAKITPDEYPCNSGTALYDAIGFVITEIDAEAKDFDRIVLVVHTDGQELNSKEFTFDQVKQLLDDKQNGEGWLVVFLGSGLSVHRQSVAMAGTASNAINALNVAESYAATARATTAYSLASTRAEGRVSSVFTPDERKRSG